MAVRRCSFLCRGSPSLSPVRLRAIERIPQKIAPTIDFITCFALNDRIVCMACGSTVWFWHFAFGVGIRSVEETDDISLELLAQCS